MAEIFVPPIIQSLKLSWGEAVSEESGQTHYYCFSSLVAFQISPTPSGQFSLTRRVYGDSAATAHDSVDAAKQAAQEYVFHGLIHLVKPPEFPLTWEQSGHGKEARRIATTPIAKYSIAGAGKRWVMVAYTWEGQAMPQTCKSKTEAQQAAQDHYDSLLASVLGGGVSGS